ncbi:MAG: RNA methyltransferase [Bacilli bacterium]|nr:RNA methyltransferase [Bacilli bacterium]
MLITSLENERIKNYIKLKDKKYRKRTNTFIVEGLHLVLEAYKSGNLIELIIEKDEVLPLDVPTIFVTNEIINKISSLETPVTVLGLCKISGKKEIEGSKVLMLDGVQDPGNLGTIIRSSVAFDVDTIVLGENTVDFYNPKVVRATQGMLFHINIINRDLESVINELKSREIPIYGTKVEYGEDVRSFPDKDKKAYGLVMGNEGSGVSSEVLDMCDKYIYIDMNEKVESLNVSIATSIILYELNR